VVIIRVFRMRVKPGMHREYEALLRGDTPKGIAYDLGLSLYTVREHIAAVYAAFGVSSRDALMARAIRDLRAPGTPGTPGTPQARP